MNWAIVGTGFISRFIASDLALTPGVRRYAVCSRDLDRAGSFAEEFGFERAFGSLEELLADPAVDLVYVATPHATHAEIAIQALRAGKHVLIEKPMAVDAAEASRIAAVAAQSGRFAMEAMWMRFNPAYRELLADVRSGRIGEARSVRATFGLPFGAADSDRWSAERVSSTLLDQGIYPVTLAIDVIGRPERIVATGTVRDDGVDLAEHFTFEYADGRFAQLGASMIEFLEPSASISGTDGWITVPAPFWSTTEFETRTGGIRSALSSSESTRHPRVGNGYVPMLTAVVEAIGAYLTEHPIHTLEDTITTLGVLDEVRRAFLADVATPEEHR
jgi:predicted dehydrogenase